AFIFGDHAFEELPAALPPGEPRKSHPPENQPLGRHPGEDGAHAGPGAEREASEVEIGKTKMGDQVFKVVDEHVGRKMSDIVRRGARSMDTKVWHDHPKALGRNALGSSELDPVDLRARKEAVEQHHRCPLARFAPRQLHAVARLEKSCFYRHGALLGADGAAAQGTSQPERASSPFCSIRQRAMSMRSCPKKGSP